MNAVVKMDERLSGEYRSKKVDERLSDKCNIERMDGKRLSGECSSKNGWKIKWWM